MVDGDQDGLAQQVFVNVANLLFGKKAELSLRPLVGPMNFGMEQNVDNVVVSVLLV